MSKETRDPHQGPQPVASRSQPQPARARDQDQVRPTAVASLDELAADPSKVAGLLPEAARRLTLRCAAVLTALTTIPLTTPHGEPVSEDRLLTIPEVADRLSVPKAYAYELARRGTLPTVRVGPKYVRVPAGAFAKWVNQQQNGLDNGIGRWHTCRNGTGRVSASAGTPGSYTSPTRRPSRRHTERRGAVGAGTATRPRAGRAASTIVRGTPEPHGGSDRAADLDTDRPT